jgi:D-inositol-3-phosphate glycosyltransferase
MESIQMSSIDDPRRPLILFVGRLSDSRKGLDVLFQALVTMDTDHDFDVWLVGGSPAEASSVIDTARQSDVLRAMLRCGRLRVWGRVENRALPELYSRATVTVMPSSREEFGIVAIEAMMCGCPVVASRVGGLQDIVLDGITGSLCPPKDAANLSRALSRYLGDGQLAALRGRQALAWASANFDQRHVYPRFASLYRTVVDGRKLPRILSTFLPAPAFDGAQLLRD